MADVLLVNIWCHDIGREQGSGKPLMKTIFQVNLKLFAPEPNRRRTVLLFVIRDKSKTPLAKVCEGTKGGAACSCRSCPCNNVLVGTHTAKSSLGAATSLFN